MIRKCAASIWTSMTHSFNTSSKFCAYGFTSLSSKLWLSGECDVSIWLDAIRDSVVNCGLCPHGSSPAYQKSWTAQTINSCIWVILSQLPIVHSKFSALEYYSPAAKSRIIGLAAFIIRFGMIEGAGVNPGLRIFQ